MSCMRSHTDVVFEMLGISSWAETHDEKKAGSIMYWLQYMEPRQRPSYPGARRDLFSAQEKDQLMKMSWKLPRLPLRGKDYHPGLQYHKALKKLNTLPCPDREVYSFFQKEGFSDREASTLAARVTGYAGANSSDFAHCAELDLFYGGRKLPKYSEIV